MNVEDYEYNARKIFDFQNEDQYNETNESWFAHHEPDPLVFTKATTEEEFKLRLPVTPRHEERAAIHSELEVEYGRHDTVEQEVVPIVETTRDEEEQRVGSLIIKKNKDTAAKKEDITILPENIKLKPSKAIQPPRLKPQSVFDRLRAHTTASAGKMSKQTAIQKKQPAQLVKKTLKKKLVLQERQQYKVITKQSQGTAKPQIQKPPVKTFTPRTITTTATPKKPSSSTPPVPAKKQPSSKVPHYMQTTASSQNKSRTATRNKSESANKPRGIKRQLNESSTHNTKRMRKK